MNDPDAPEARAAARRAFEDLLHLRGPVEQIAEPLLPYLSRTHQGMPVATVTREALCGAIRAHQTGALSGRELRAWAILVHGEIATVAGRAPYLGLEPAARLRLRLRLHHALDRLIEDGPDHYTEHGLERIMISLTASRTDLGWLARRPGVTTGIELAAIALWTVAIAPALVAPWLPDAITALAISSLGGYAISIAIVRWLPGPEAAADRFQTFLPFALLGIAATGAAYVLGGLR